MDSSLPIGKRIRVRIHLLTCRFCAIYERQLLLIRKRLRGFAVTEDPPEEPAGETLSQEARERIKESLRSR
ncbi:MAG: hypothetical protein Kow00128_15310 [Deltaproteobacteria bacterium]